MQMLSGSSSGRGLDDSAVPACPGSNHHYYKHGRGGIARAVRSRSNAASLAPACSCSNHHYYSNHPPTP